MFCPIPTTSFAEERLDRAFFCAIMKTIPTTSFAEERAAAVLAAVAALTDGDLFITPRRIDERITRTKASGISLKACSMPPGMPIATKVTKSHSK